MRWNHFFNNSTHIKKNIIFYETIGNGSNLPDLKSSKKDSKANLLNCPS